MNEQNDNCTRLIYLQENAIFMSNNIFYILKWKLSYFSKENTILPTIKKNA